MVALFRIEPYTLTLVALTEGAPTDSFDTTSTLGRFVLRRAEPRFGRIGPPVGE